MVDTMKLYKYGPFCVLLIACLVGCSDNVKMGGKVVFSDNDESLGVGTVCFQQPGFLARGELRPDGTYDIGSTSEKNGLPAGVYSVYVTGADAMTQDEKSGMTTLTPLIDERFANPATSGLSFEVTDRTRRFDFKVDRYKK